MRIMISFSVAISACGECSQWEQALSLLGEMRKAGMTRDVITFSPAISACEKGGQWELAVQSNFDVISFNSITLHARRVGIGSQRKVGSGS